LKEGPMKIKKPISKAGRWVFLVWRSLLATAPGASTMGLVGLRPDLFLGESIAGFSGFHVDGRAYYE
jgi:hypothetical protein